MPESDLSEIKKGPKKWAKKKNKAFAEAVESYFTDWYKTDVLSELLWKQAGKNRGPILSGEDLEKKFGTAVRDRVARQSAANNPPDVEEVFQTFMFSGVDYRGQAQSGIEQLGYGGGVNASIDLAKLEPVIAGNVFTAKISAGAAATLSSFQFVYVGHMGNPKDYASPIVYSDWSPVLGVRMLGSAKNFKTELGVEAGFKVDTANFTGISSGFESGAIAFGVGAKVTGQGKVAYSGTWVVATNWHPRFYQRGTERLHKDVIENIKTADLGLRAKQLVPSKHDPECYLNWSIHEPEASAGFAASVTATASVGSGLFDKGNDKGNYGGLGFGASATASANAGNIEYTGKYSAYRLNLPAPDREHIVSQETKIKYAKFVYTGISMALGIRLGPARTTAKSNWEDKYIKGLAKKDQRLSPKPDLLDNQAGFGTAFIPEIDLGSGMKFSTPTVDVPELKYFEGSAKYGKIAVTSKGVAIDFLSDQFDKLKKQTSKVFLNALSYEVGLAVWSKHNAYEESMPCRLNLFINGTGYIRGQSITLPTLFGFYSNYHNMADLFGEEAMNDPRLAEITSSIKNLINSQLMASKTDLPTNEQWLRESSSTTARRTIKEVDKALSKIWEIRNKFAKLYGSTDPAEAIFIEADRKIKKNDKTIEQIRQESCLAAIAIIQSHLKAISRAYIDLLKSISGWIKHKVKSEDIDDLIKVSPDRGPQVISLDMRARVDFKVIDQIASLFDVLEEFFSLKLVERKLSESLNVTTEQFLQFLASDEIHDTIMDFVDLTSTKPEQVPGAFIIESTFKLDQGDLRTLNTHYSRGAQSLVNEAKDDVKDGFTKKIYEIIKDNSKDKLQSISIRYRMGDTKIADRTFKLGFSIGQGVTLGIKLDRVRKSASDGSFLAGVYWFNSFKEYNQGGGKLGWPDGTVSTPYLMT